MNSVSPFHLAIPVWNLDVCRVFYRDILGCEEGRHSDHWVDFNFFGHQLVIHFKPKEEETDLHVNKVDGKQVPVPHFGVLLPWEEFETFSERLKAQKIDLLLNLIFDLKDRLANKPHSFFMILLGML